MGAVVDCATYENGRRVASVGIDQIDRSAAAPGRLDWIGLYEPDEALLRKVQRRFGLHDLAIEDAHRAHQRPKLEVYGDSLFLVMRTAQLVDSAILFGETHLFVGKGYVISVRHGPPMPYAEVRNRCESAPKLLRKGEDFVLYALIDFIVDNYFPVVDTIEAEVDEVEDGVFKAPFERKDIERIHDLRRRLMTLRRAVSPLVEVCNRLMRFDLPVIDRDTLPYFRDVQDHVIRISERIDILRDILAAALEANLQIASLRQSEVMKRLAGWAAILAVPTAVAGIYGMNFRYMPELEWRLGYPLIMAGIAAACGYLYYRFRRAGWL